MSLVDERLRNLLRALCQGKEKWPLFLHGPAGTGKSSAGLALCDYAPTATFLTLDDVCDRIMRGEHDLEEWLASKHLAVLDELGTRNKATDLPYTAAKKFCDARHGMPAIYISNLPPSQIAVLFDDRIASRVLCGTWFELSGADRRVT